GWARTDPPGAAGMGAGAPGVGGVSDAGGAGRPPVGHRERAYGMGVAGELGNPAARARGDRVGPAPRGNESGAVRAGGPGRSAAQGALRPGLPPDARAGE